MSYLTHALMCGTMALVNAAVAFQSEHAACCAASAAFAVLCGVACMAAVKLHLAGRK